MDFSTWLFFLAVALITALTPGPGVLLVVSNAVGFGARAAILCSLGNAIGLFFVSGATMVGLGALLRSSVILFAVLKILGAGYLIYLGVRQWRSQTNIFAQAKMELCKKERSDAKFLLQGLFLAPTNPKAILFFAALLPQFIKPEKPILAQFLIFTATFSIATVTSHVAYTYLAHRVKNYVSTNRRAKILNRVFGGTLMFLGFGMLRLKNN